jgi:hypothetical protein
MNTSGRETRVRYQEEILRGKSCTSVIRQLGQLGDEDPVGEYIQQVQTRCRQLYGKTIRKTPLLFLRDLESLGEIKIYEIRDGKR